MREREIKWGESVLAWAWGKLSNIYVWHCDCETETPVPVHHSGAHQCVYVPRPTATATAPHCTLAHPLITLDFPLEVWQCQRRHSTNASSAYPCHAARFVFRASSASLSLSLVFGLQLIWRALRVKSFFFSSHSAFTLPTCLCPACLWFQLNALN